MRLTRIELCDLAAQLTNDLRDFVEGSAERFKTNINLPNFRRDLARRDFLPG